MKTTNRRNLFILVFALLVVMLGADRWYSAEALAKLIEIPDSTK